MEEDEYLSRPPPERTGHDSARRRLVLVHGFAQNRACWGRFAEGLAADHHDSEPVDLVALDVGGHGAEAATRRSFAEEADRIGDIGGHATYVGYSMGARLCLQLTIARPNLVDRLVLIGGSPGLADPMKRAQRAAADAALADRIESIGVAAFLDEWLAQPLFAGLSSANQFREKRLQNTAAGLASSLRLAGNGTQPNLWPSLSGLQTPTLLLTGAHDTKFTVTAQAMVTLMPPGVGRHVVIAKAGHSPHLERPDATIEAIGQSFRSVISDP